MPTPLAPGDMSDIESEFELELGDQDQDHEQAEDDVAAEFRELEESDEQGHEATALEDGGFAERFYELSLQQFEDDVEVDDRVNRLLSEMEHEAFFGKLIRKAKRFAKKLVKKVGKVVGGLPPFQIIKGVTQLARGNLRGMLGSLAKAAIGAGVSAIPGGAAALPVLRRLGFGETEDPQAAQEAWSNYVSLANEAYGELAVDPRAGTGDPATANAAAAAALQRALARTAVGRPVAGASGNGRVRRSRIVRLRPGDRLVIEVVER